MENILGTKTAVKILSLLLKSTRSEFKESDLFKETKAGRGAGATAINNLASSGILRIKRAGKTKIVSLNASNPLASALKQLFGQYRLLSLPGSRVSAIFLFRKLAYKKSRAIVLFGSLAAGTYTEKSDIDLLVITDSQKEINNVKREVFELTGESINIHFLYPRDIKKESEDNDLVRNALIYGIAIYGADYVQETVKPAADLKELFFLKERIGAAWRNYAEKDIESAEEIARTILQDISFLICKIEGLPALSRKDAVLEAANLKEYCTLKNINNRGLEDRLRILEDVYARLLNKTILKGEGIER